MKTGKYLLLAALLLVGRAYADNLTVGVESIDYYPFYEGDKGDYTGFGREVLDAFAAKYHHTLTYERMDIPSLLQAMLTGKVDLKFPDDADWVRDKRAGKTIYYSMPVINVSEGLMVPAASAGKGIESIHRIGIVKGFSPFPYLSLIGEKRVTVMQAGSFSALVRAGVMKSVDGIYISPTIGNYQLKNIFHNPGLMVFDKSLPNAHSGFSVSSTKRQDVVKQFDEFLVKDKSVVDALRKKYNITE